MLESVLLIKNQLDLPILEKRWMNTYTAMSMKRNDGNVAKTVQPQKRDS